MNHNTEHKPHVHYQCDFCKTDGLLNLSIFNHAGWYYCQNCLTETNTLVNRVRNNENQLTIFPIAH